MSQPQNYYRGRRPVNILGSVEITETGISYHKWKENAQASGGTPANPVTMELLITYAIRLGLMMRLPFEDPIVQHRVMAAQDQREAFVRDVVEQAALRVQRDSAALTQVDPAPENQPPGNDEPPDKDLTQWEGEGGAP